MGITRGAYSNIENGKREPDISTLTLLADYYNVTIDYLVNHKENGGNKMNTIGSRIKSIREKEQYTLEQFSSLLEIPSDQLQRIESDEEVPSPHIVKIIGTQFNIHDQLISSWPKDVLEDFIKIKNDTETLCFYEHNGVPYDHASSYLSLVNRLNPPKGKRIASELQQVIESSFGEGSYDLLQDFSSMNEAGKAEARKQVHLLTYAPDYKKQEEALKNA